jgi:hypothetical protein
MYPQLSLRAFTAQKGTAFTVMVEGGRAVTLTLTEVKILGTRQTGDLTIESYSLIFEGPTSPMLAQSSFEFVHDQMGELVIFIVPLGPIEGVMRYEAVFN